MQLRFVERVVLITILACGLGLVCAGYSVVDAVLLKPLPYRSPEGLVRVAIAADNGTAPLTKHVLLSLRSETSVLSGLDAYHTLNVELGRRGSANTQGGVAAFVTPTVFSLLGTTAKVGRLLTLGDGHLSSPMPVVISSRMAARWSIADLSKPDLLVDGVNYEVVGIASDQFWFPDASIDIWIPLITEPIAGVSWSGFGIARLRDHVSLEVAQRRMQETANAFGIGANQITIQPYHDAVTESSRGPLTLVLGAGILIALLAGTAVTWILVSAVNRSRKRVAIMVALGASPWRIARAPVLEGLAALLLAFPLAAALATLLLGTILVADFHVLPTGAPATPTFDSVLVAWLVGSAITLVAIAVSVGASLRVHHLEETMSKDGHEPYAARWIIALQTTVVVAVTAQAIWVAWLLHTAVDRNVGFTRTDVYHTRLVPTGATIPNDSLWLRINGVLTELSQMDIAAAAASTMPLADGWMRASVRLVPQQDRRDYSMVRVTAVTPGYFQVIGFHPEFGRVLDQADRNTRRLVVNQAFVDRILKPRAAIGATIEFGDYEPWQIIGVVPTVGQLTLRDSDQPEAYILFDSASLVSIDWRNYLLRRPFILASGPSSRLRGAGRPVISRVFPEFEIAQFESFERTTLRALSGVVLVRRLSWIVSLSASFILAVAILGLMEIRSSRRTREVALRLALGASPTRLLISQARELVQLVVIPAAAGGLLFWFTVSYFRPLLQFSVRAVEPSLWQCLALAVSALAVAIAPVALRPIWRLASISPSSLLRES